MGYYQRMVSFLVILATSTLGEVDVKKCIDENQNYRDYQLLLRYDDHSVPAGAFLFIELEFNK
jgi:hypothetical protein